MLLWTTSSSINSYMTSVVSWPAGCSSSSLGQSSGRHVVNNLRSWRTVSESKIDFSSADRSITAFLMPTPITSHFVMATASNRFPSVGLSRSPAAIAPTEMTNCVRVLQAISSQANRINGLLNVHTRGPYAHRTRNSGRAIFSVNLYISVRAGAGF
jgi:hypothetical protein